MSEISKDLVDKLLAPKTKKKTEYVDAPEVEEIANELIDRFGLSDARAAKIKYLKKISEKSRNLGTCTLASKKWKYLTNYDYVIEVWDEFWDAVDNDKKEALVYHELLHIMMVEKNDGSITWRLRKHDVESFIDVVRHYGAWESSLVSMVEALEEQSSGQSET